MSQEINKVAELLSMRSPRRVRLPIVAGRWFIASRMTICEWRIGAGNRLGCARG
jgi:hypothetical protein